jgi:lipopolysaccharide transport system permease protein
MAESLSAAEPDARAPAEWVELQPPRGWRQAFDVREPWRYRDVFRALFLRKFKARYKQAALGFGWAVIQPLTAVVLFTLVFGRLAGLSSDGLPYAIFVLCGLVVWNFLAAAVTAATTSLVTDPDLVTKVYFPRILAPAAAASAPLIDLAIGVVVLLIALPIYGVTPGPQIVLLPAVLAATGLLATAVGAALAAANVRFRDVGEVIGLAVQLWFFATPVVFSSEAVHGAARTLLSLNPMTGLVDAARWVVLDAHAPPAVDLLSLAVGLVVSAGALAYFHAMQPRFADLI